MPLPFHSLLIFLVNLELESEHIKLQSSLENNSSIKLKEIEVDVRLENSKNNNHKSEWIDKITLGIWTIHPNYEMHLLITHYRMRYDSSIQIGNQIVIFCDTSIKTRNESTTERD